MPQTKRVDEAAVLAVQEPEWTKTWHPISHARLINSLGEITGSKNLDIMDRTYSLNQSGTQMFGTWTVRHAEYSDRNWMIGMRNSLDKALAVGLTAGLYVVVCSNMVFSGEFVEFRKHTGGLDDLTLNALCEKAVDGIMSKLVEFDRWYQHLEDYQIQRRHMNYLVVESMRRGALPPSHFNQFCKLYFDEGGRYFKHKPTLTDFHGAVTEIMREDSLFLIERKNKALTGLVNEFEILYERNGSRPV